MWWLPFTQAEGWRLRFTISLKRHECPWSYASIWCSVLVHLALESSLYFLKVEKSVAGRKKSNIPRRVLPCHSCERKSKLNRIVHSVFHTYLESPFSLKRGSKACSDTPVVLLRTMFHIPGIFMDGQSLFFFFFFKYRQVSRCESRPVVFNRGIWICSKKRTCRKF